MTTSGWWRKAAPLFLLALIVAGSTGLTLRWAFLVPIFQSPDEPMHLDYALCLMDHGWLFRAVPSPQKAEPIIHPWTNYLVERAYTGAVAFHPENPMPADYGTPAYFEALDQQAPPRPAALRGAPILTAVYPYGYYALLAGWLWLVHLVRDGPVAMAFGARLMSVLLTSVSVALSYAAARELGVRRRLALALTANIGFLPLTSFVGSYAQPDVLAFTLMSLAFWLALRLRRPPAGAGLVAALGLVLGLLLVTKVHFYLCVLPPVLAALALGRSAPRPPRAWVRSAALLLAPSLLLGLVYGATVWGRPNWYVNAPPQTPTASLWARFAAALLDFVGRHGATHLSFWGVFGWMDTLLKIGSSTTTARVRLALWAGTWAVLALSLLRLGKVAARLVRLWRRGKARAALRLATANVPVNSFFLFTVLMFVLYVRSGNSFGAQGRNWLPFLLPIFLMAAAHAPRALSLRLCRLCTWGVVLGLLLFVGAGSYYSLRTIQHRYYAPAATATPSPPRS